MPIADAAWASRLRRVSISTKPVPALQNARGTSSCSRNPTAGGAVDLVIQAPAIPAAQLSAIAAMTAAQDVTMLHDAGVQAYRLAQVASRADVAELCAAAGIDCAFVPPELERRRVRLVALDMDSTLIAV